MDKLSNKNIPPTLPDFESPHMTSRMVLPSQVHPVVELVPSHQYLDYQTPPNILAQIQSAVINRDSKTTN